MQTHRLVIELSKKDEIIQLRPLGDIHIGNVACDLDKFKANIDFVKDHDNYYTIGMGDYIDNIMAYAGGAVDKRWNPETTDRQTLTTEEQTDLFVKLWQPIAKKTLGFIVGNHEWKTINQRRFIKDFCEPLGVKYLGRLALIGLSFTYKGKELRHYEIVALHGGYAGIRAGGTINRLEDIVDSFENIDLGIMGHSHRLWAYPTSKIGRDRTTNRPYQRKIILANTGTFLKSYNHGTDGYEEINPKKALRVGTVTITFDPYHGDIFSHE